MCDFLKSSVWQGDVILLLAKETLIVILVKRRANAQKIHPRNFKREEIYSPERFTSTVNDQ